MEPDIIKYRVKKNYSAILRDLEPKKVISYLYQEDIVDDDDMDEVKSERTRKKQAETLLAIMTRGDIEGYRVLVQALEECQPHLADLLKTAIISEQAFFSGLKNKGNFQQHNENSPAYMKIEQQLKELGLRGSSDPVEVTYEPPPPPSATVHVKPTSFDLISQLYRPDSVDAVYKMKRNPRGYAVIINFQKFDPNPKYTDERLEHREGSAVDGLSLERLFTGLDYEVESLHDLTLEETTKKISDLSRRDYSGYDSFVLCLMSHGKEDFIYTSDGGQVKITSIRKAFSNGECSTLAGKPKMFFIQACRGENKDFGSVVQDGAAGEPTEHQEMEAPVAVAKQFKFDLTSDTSEGPTTADMADFLLAYSSVDGHASFRNTRDGSRFIRCLVDVFTRYAGVEDVLSMLTRVINLVNRMGGIGTKQVPQPETTLTKKVFFWPGVNFP